MVLNPATLEGKHERRTVKACKSMTAAKHKNNAINRMKAMPYKTHDSPLCPFLWKKKRGKHIAITGTMTNQILALISLAQVLEPQKHT